MITQYINYLREVRNLSENTVRAYEKDLRAFARWGNEKHLTWRTVEKQDIDSWTASRYGLLSPASIKRGISSVRSFLRWMQHEGYLSSNAATFCQSPKLPQKLPDTANLEELTAYLQTEANTEDARCCHALVALLKDTGIRLQEAIDLRLEHFDIRTNSIRIKGKGSKERIVYYTDNLLQYLAPVANMRPGYVLPIGSQYQLRMMLYKELRKAGISSTHPHAIRHAWATNMLNSGADIATISFLMGHESIKTTQRYAKLSNATARRIYQQINN